MMKKITFRIKQGEVFAINYFIGDKRHKDFYMLSGTGKEVKLRKPFHGIHSNFSPDNECYLALGENKLTPLQVHNNHNMALSS